jgi:hypothetical protein
MNPKRTMVSALVLLCVLFQPAATFAAQLLKADPVMSCCRSKRSCCCRKDGKRSHLPAWKAAVDCKRTCSQNVAIVRTDALLDASAGRTSAERLTDSGVVAQPVVVAASASYLAFLHQRPPPSLSR